MKSSRISASSNGRESGESSPSTQLRQLISAKAPPSPSLSLSDNSEVQEELLGSASSSEEDFTRYRSVLYPRIFYELVQAIVRVREIRQSDPWQVIDDPILLADALVLKEEHLTPSSIINKFSSAD